MGFLDVETPAGGSSEFCAVPGADRITLLSLNLLQNGLASADLFPGLSNLYPNPSSALAWMPAVNIREGQRHRAWIGAGLFVFGETAFPRGAEMVTATAGNYNFRVTDSGGTANVDIRTATPTTFLTGGDAVASALEAKLNADATLNGTYTVTYSGRDDDVAQSFQFKFTITCTETFSLVALRATDANSGFPSIGFTSDRSGDSGYISDERAIHTEEALVIDLGDPTWKIGTTTVCDRWSWIYFVDCNFTGVDEADAYGGAKMVAYLGSTLADVNNKVDANFTANRTMFHLGRSTTVGAKIASLGLYDGTDAGMYPMRAANVTNGAFPCRIYAVNIQRWRAANNTGSNAYAPNHRYLRLKFVDRSNPHGFLKVGKIYVGPGVTFKRNWAWEGEESPIDRSEFSEGTDGGVLRRFREPGRARGGGWSEDNPLTSNEAMLIDSLLIRGRRCERDSSGNLISTPGGDSMISNPRVIAGKSGPTMVMDPAPLPSLADASAKFGGQMAYGTGVFEDLSPLGPNSFSGTFHLDGEAL